MQDGLSAVSDLEELVIQISYIISSMKLSLNPVPSKSQNIAIEIDSSARIVGYIEQIRYKFTARTRNARYSSHEKHNIDALAELKNSFTDLTNDKEYVRISSQNMFRMQAGVRDRVELIKKIEQRLFANISVYDATSIMIELIEKQLNYININIVMSPNDLEKSSDLSYTNAIKNLRAIVPPQKIAPVQFKIDNHKISIEKFDTKPENRDKKNTTFAKNEIMKNGEKIIEQLKKSNCDRRLLENVEYLQSQIVEDSNVIQIGISNISVGLMTQTFRNELPDAITSMLQSHNVTINMYVAQFPDWNRFSENAALSELTETDIEVIRKSANDIIDYIEKNTDIAEPRVVRAFKQLSTLVENPARTSKRAAFAVIRSIENLISKTFHYTINFFEQTATEVSKTASKTLAIIIVTLALNSATSLISISERLSELTWLKNAIEIVQKQIKVSK